MSLGGLIFRHDFDKYKKMHLAKNEGIELLPITLACDFDTALKDYL